MQHMKGMKFSVRGAQMMPDCNSEASTMLTISCETPLLPQIRFLQPASRLYSFSYSPVVDKHLFNAKQSAALLAFTPSYTSLLFFPFYINLALPLFTLVSSACTGVLPRLLKFFPVGLCVCCNELYLITKWDSRP